MSNITFLRKMTNGEMSNVAFKTDEVTLGGVTKVVCTVVGVDANLKHLTKPTVYELPDSEEVFHTGIRKEAAEKGHLITSHCTNPEWNPEGYGKNLEDED